MKKLILSLMVLAAIVSCQKEQKDYAVISGKIVNPNSKKITISDTNGDFEQIIAVAEDGTFKDTLKNVSGKYRLNDGKEMITIRLENGYDLTINVDTKEFDETLAYEGAGADVNNYLAKKQLIDEKYVSNSKELYILEEDKFLEKVNAYKEELDVEANKLKGAIAKAEKEDNDLQRRLTLGQYEGYHGYLTQNREFAVSDNFPNVYEGINLWDNEKYDKSPAYQQLAMQNFGKELREKAKADSLDTYAAAVGVLKTKEKGVITDAILMQLISGLSGDSEKDKVIVDAINDLSTEEKVKQEMEKKIANQKAVAKGNESPKFEYENYKGGTTSLDDLKGKFVYIDVWATWCGPCKAEIPHLKKLEEKYRNKAVAFVSISVDKAEDKDKWKKMIEEKEMKGVQLFADKAWKSDFVQAYSINGIPRFILLDKEGKIISANAPRPSNPALISLLKESGL